MGIMVEFGNGLVPNSSRLRDMRLPSFTLAIQVISSMESISLW